MTLFVRRRRGPDETIEFGTNAPQPTPPLQLTFAELFYGTPLAENSPTQYVEIDLNMMRSMIVSEMSAESFSR